MLVGLIRRGIGKQGRSSSEWAEIAFESTNFALTTQVPRPPERRADERVVLALPVAKLNSGEWQDFCRIRNISAGGVMAELTGPPPPVDTALTIEFNSHHSLSGTIVWVREPLIGIKFDRFADLRDLLDKPRARGGFLPRPPRLEIRCDATVRIGKLYHRAEIRDISLGGVKVALNDRDCIGKTVVVTAESLRPIKGVIRWYKEGHAGVIFNKPLTFDELAEWLGKRVAIASHKVGAWERRQ